MRSDAIGYAWRGLRRTPGVLAVVVLVLSLGIGGATAMFAVVDAFLLNPLPYANGAHLIEIGVRLSPTDTTRGLAAPAIAAIRARTDVFAGVEAYRMGASTVTTGDPELLASPTVSPGLLHLLGAKPVMGRLLTVDDARAEAPGVLISERVWRTRFGSAADVTSRRIGIEGVPHPIVGVLPAWFGFPERTADVWLPLAMENGVPQGGWEVAVLRPGTSRETAAAALGAVSAALERDGVLPAGASLYVMDPVQVRVNNRYRTELWLLLGAVLLVLVVACVNVAHLMLARASARRGELAVLSALGASRGAVVRLVLVESVVVAVLGGAGGALVARAFFTSLVAAMPDRMLMLASGTIDLDWRALAFTIGLATATCLSVALLPALHMRRLDVVEALKGRAPGAGGAGDERWHRGLVVAQLALVTTLMITAGLLLRSFTRLVNVDPGVRTEGLITADVQFPHERYATPGAARAVMATLDARLSALPGVEGVTVSNGVPPSAGDLAMDARPEADGLPPYQGERIELPMLRVAPDFFTTLGIPIVQGRAFTTADGADAVIVNTVLARRIWGDASPIGRRFRASNDQDWQTVVGVAGDVKVQGLRDTRGAGMETYSPYGEAHGRGGYFTLTVRARGDAGDVGRRIRDELKALDPLLPVLELATLDERFADSVQLPRFLLRLAGTFAIVAALLAAIGVYGTMAYWVARRQRELGVRVALGSSPGGLVRLVVGRGARIAAIAGAGGLGGAVLLAGTLEPLLFQTDPGDLTVFATALIGLGALVLAACAVPAMRAARVDPIRALRAE
jgi:putative ABC transport system permease protein